MAAHIHSHGETGDVRRISKYFDRKPAMMPYFTEVFGNPSSVYSFAAKSRKAIDTARGQVARALNADPDEIFFTGSGIFW